MLPQFLMIKFEKVTFEELIANAGAYEDAWLRSAQSNTAAPPTPARESWRWDDTVIADSL